MRLGKRPGRLRFEKDASARTNKVFVEHPLVKAALPPAPVQRVEGLPACLNPGESVARLAPAPYVQIPLQRVLSAHLLGPLHAPLQDRAVVVAVVVCVRKHEPGLLVCFCHESTNKFNFFLLKLIMVKCFMYYTNLYNTNMYYTNLYNTNMYYTHLYYTNVYFTNMYCTCCIVQKRSYMISIKAGQATFHYS